ncbi:MAG: hypothetical protein HC923_00790 [Myxococcales bacterium]|nr:hypothetical protein [Myxococcales bacterium]
MSKVQIRGDLELVGSQGAARAMRIELARLAPRGVDRPKPTSVDESSLAIPYDPSWALLLLRYSRTISRLFWTWGVVREDRLEGLVAGLREVVESISWKGRATFSVEVRSKGDFRASPLQMRGCAKSVLERDLGWTLDAERPEVVVSLRASLAGSRWASISAAA